MMFCLMMFCLRLLTAYLGGVGAVCITALILWWCGMWSSEDVTASMQRSGLIGPVIGVLLMLVIEWENRQD